jgi:hypothetical protein
MLLWPQRHEEAERERKIKAQKLKAKFENILQRGADAARKDSEFRSGCVCLVPRGGCGPGVGGAALPTPVNLPNSNTRQQTPQPVTSQRVCFP